MDLRLCGHINEPVRVLPLDVVSLLMGLARGLPYIRGKNLLLRDIKPENILVEKLFEGNIKFVSVDLGISKALSRCLEVQSVSKVYAECLSFQTQLSEADRKYFQTHGIFMEHGGSPHPEGNRHD